jgi:DNA-binding CsgD family transcriptional regulator/tetratricopeptide (TPR) repeat protein
LLRPVLDRVADLPERQARALRGAFALAADPRPPDALLTGMAVLTLLGGVSEDGPLLVVADDAQWLDHGSLATLAFTARRLSAEPVTVLLAARGAGPPAGFDRGFPELVLPPLSARDAGRLLDAQPVPPRGRARAQVLAEAAGNPMALVELARIIATDPAAGRRWAAEPLRPADRLSVIAAAQLAGLPAAAAEALVLAAAADVSDLTSLGLPGFSAQALAPAEAAGLIRVDTSGPRFAHPLVRSAVYHAAPFAERAAAHRRIAEALRERPDRYAWHLAAASLGPDEDVAALLEETAAQAQRRGGTAAAARALERAAELSPRPEDQARRLLDATAVAGFADQADWVQDLAAQVMTVTEDPVQRITARGYAGWALAWSDRHAEALATLLPVVAEAASLLPELAWWSLGLAAVVAYQTGAAGARDAVQRELDRLTGLLAAGRAVDGADEQRAWIHACLQPFGERARVVPALYRAARGAADGGSAGSRGTIGAAAWLLDESELAVTTLREALSELSAAGARGRSGGTLSALEWACVDSGRLDEALAAAREANDTAASYPTETVAASALLAVATVLALRGDADQARQRVTSALATVNPVEYRGFAARARHAAGLAALGEGRHDLAYAQLRRLFDADGVPLHHHVTYLGIADLAAAGVRAGRGQEAGALIEGALARVGAAPGARLEQLAARARCLLAEAGDADGAPSAETAGTEAQFEKALADPAGEAWPFERARLRLDYGEWLRRQRRINDAKPVLLAALETFGRLGATPWAARAQAELRACGVAAQADQAAPGALTALTPQQREIAVLASRGLTNGEIADRLYLSPHTVASHLYRSYPKLGVAGRHQLRDLVDQAGADRRPEGEAGPRRG